MIRVKKNRGKFPPRFHNAAQTNIVSGAASFFPDPAMAER